MLYPCQSWFKFLNCIKQSRDLSWNTKLAAFQICYSSGELLQSIPFRHWIFFVCDQLVFDWRENLGLVPRDNCVNVLFYSAWTEVKMPIIFPLRNIWMRLPLTAEGTTPPLRMVNYDRRFYSWRPTASSITCGNTTTAKSNVISGCAPKCSPHCTATRRNLTTASTSTLCRAIPPN